MVSGPVFRNFNTRLICVIQTVSRVFIFYNMSDKYLAFKSTRGKLKDFINTLKPPAKS